jgi:hypothetical protein
VAELALALARPAGRDRPPTAWEQRSDPGGVPSPEKARRFLDEFRAAQDEDLQRREGPGR